MRKLTVKEIDNRLQLCYQKLRLATLYNADFVKKLGPRGWQAFIDEHLDEINRLNRKKNDLKNEKK